MTPKKPLEYTITNEVAMNDFRTKSGSPASWEVKTMKSAAQLIGLLLIACASQRAITFAGEPSDDADDRANVEHLGEIR